MISIRAARTRRIFQKPRRTHLNGHTKTCSCCARREWIEKQASAEKASFIVCTVAVVLCAKWNEINTEQDLHVARIQKNELSTVCVCVRARKKAKTRTSHTQAHMNVNMWK